MNVMQSMGSHQMMEAWKTQKTLKGFELQVLVQLDLQVLRCLGLQRPQEDQSMLAVQRTREKA